ncbi:MAG: HupE/UreJ family protein, partial [Altererythrobacter sp.]|nr:HupE/UreJ family protein [Altererythrobacter sp.]
MLLFAALIGSAPAAADELRPFAIEFTERAPGQWALAWKQPLAAASMQAPVNPLVPANCRFAGDPVSRPAALAIIGHAQVLC